MDDMLLRSLLALRMRRSRRGIFEVPDCPKILPSTGPFSFSSDLENRCVLGVDDPERKVELEEPEISTFGVNLAFALSKRLLKSLTTKFSIAENHL